MIWTMDVILLLNVFNDASINKEKLKLNNNIEISHGKNVLNMRNVDIKWDVASLKHER